MLDLEVFGFPTALEPLKLQYHTNMLPCTAHSESIQNPILFPHLVTSVPLQYVLNKSTHNEKAKTGF